MFFDLFRAASAGKAAEDDISTGTYADGAVGTPAADRSSYAEGRLRRWPAETREDVRRRMLTLTGAGLTA